MDLTQEDVADILALLDTLPYDELDLETPRFRLTLRRTPSGWTQSTQILSAPQPAPASAPAPAVPAPASASAPAPASEAAASAPASASAPAPEDANGVCGPLTPSIGVRGPHTPASDAGGGEGEVGGVGEAGGEEAGREETGGEEAGGEEAGGEETGLVAVRAPLPGTFYRAPRPGAAPFAKVGSRVGADTVIGIVETMKLMNPVHAGVAGVVAEFCVGNAEFAAHGAPLLRIRADR